MSFADAVRSVLTQYVGFTGRARRSEYWYFVLAYLILDIVVSIIDGVIGTQILAYLLGLALLLPSLAVGVRRLHDTNRSGWWILIGLIPLVGAIILIVFFVQEGSAGPNAYGADPKPRPGMATA
jgi:uncharacterized membrane protein YhaH (DUF805 family)